ncbi:MAG TPA: twin-arginine translocase TatA/TatE family subunit [Polyangiaceae bacterium]|jgi:sec-independent protein translocase protein TatA|nr:twin-arginine translocase TatA/TatE family subunit [Polyangiaceae bacterium]
MMSPVHWVIVALIVVLLFGGNKLSEVGKGLGEGIRSFKKGVSDSLGDEAPAKVSQVKRAEDESDPQHVSKDPEPHA